MPTLIFQVISGFCYRCKSDENLICYQHVLEANGETNSSAICLIYIKKIKVEHKTSQTALFQIPFRCGHCLINERPTFIKPALWLQSILRQPHLFISISSIISILQ